MTEGDGRKSSPRRPIVWSRQIPDRGKPRGRLLV